MLSTGWVIVLTLSMPAPSAPSPVADPWADSRPITRFVQNLGHDIGALPSLRSAIIFGAGGAAAAVAHRSDVRVANWAASLGPSSHTAFGRIAGDARAQWAAAGATYLTGRLSGSRPLTHIGGDLIRAQALNGLITQGLKYAVGRTRPNGGSHAFPSGHESGAFATAAVLQAHFGWWAGAPAYAFAGYIGWSRLRDRAHWASDVAFGAAVGLAAGYTVAAGHRPSNVTIVPAAGRDAFGLFVFWSPPGGPKSR